MVECNCAHFNTISPKLSHEITPVSSETGCRILLEIQINLVLYEINVQRLIEEFVPQRCSTPLKIAFISCEYDVEQPIQKIQPSRT